MKGRKRILEVSELSEVNENIREKAFTLSTLTVDEVKLDIQKLILKKKGLNSHANINEFASISTATVKTYIKDINCKEMVGKIQAKSRVDAVDAAKPKKVRSCAQLDCNNNIDVTTSALKKTNEATWKKCKGTRCHLWACPDHFAQIAQHELICVKCSD